MWASSVITNKLPTARRNNFPSGTLHIGDAMPLLRNVSENVLRKWGFPGKCNRPRKNPLPTIIKGVLLPAGENGLLMAQVLVFISVVQIFQPGITLG
jgi:hypothetical protein